MAEEDICSLGGVMLLNYSYSHPEKNSITNINKQSGLDIQGCHRDASGYVRPGLTGKKMIHKLITTLQQKEKTAS